ncbi:putative quinol monooxygenase [Pseudarthrobacter sp. J1738]|uniref:putative quinol monooxygenase n=1 Tax=unclassified Pseudarthrobacter TaxID=2647000 RepID=UPI003D297051
MIFITAKFPVKPEHADAWPEISREFTEATNAEAGCVFFEWSRSVEEPNTYVLLEAFRDDEAGGEHVQSDHFQKATQTLPAYLSETPDIVNVKVDGWSKLGEMEVPAS